MATIPRLSYREVKPNPGSAGDFIYDTVIKYFRKKSSY